MGIDGDLICVFQNTIENSKPKRTLKLILLYILMLSNSIRVGFVWNKNNVANNA